MWLPAKTGGRSYTRSGDGSNPGKIGAVVADSSLFRQAMDQFETIHGEDPRRVAWQGAEIPWSVLYHRRLEHWVRTLSPDASEALLLAAGCQHIRRWTIPRDRYPADRQGYKQWRGTLAKFHAGEAQQILTQLGFDQKTVGRVQEFLRKSRLKLDPEVQLFEDAICLVFLENEFIQFSRKHEEEKLAAILKKTWRKMSPQGHEAAQELARGLPLEARELIEKVTA